MKIIVFDEREETLKHSALNEQEDYVFIRLNPHLSSHMDTLLTIDFICFGKTATQSLQKRPLATSKEMLDDLIMKRPIH